MELWTYNNGDIKIKEYSKVTYLVMSQMRACHERLWHKINGRLKFIYRKNRYLTPYLNKIFKRKLHTVQNKKFKNNTKLKKIHVKKIKLSKKNNTKLEKIILS